MSNIAEWTAATSELRKQLSEDFYLVALAEIEAERKGKDTTERERNKARNRAKGMVISALYKTAEHNGVRNPVHDDDVWGPGASKTASAPAAKDPEVEALVEWLAAQTWSSFAVSLAEQYKTRGSLSPKQLSSAKSMKAKMDAKAEREAEATPSGIDLTEIPSGYYAVPGGDTRLKVRIAHGKPGSKWDGWTFVSDGAEYGQRKNYGSQRPGGTYKGDIAEQLSAIVAAPEAAQRAYGRLTGTCGACGRLLEDESSIEAGIGPICESKWEM